MTPTLRQWSVKVSFKECPAFIVYTGTVEAESEMEAERIWNNRPISERIPFFPPDVTKRLEVIAFVPGILMLIGRPAALEEDK